MNGQTSQTNKQTSLSWNINTTDWKYPPIACAGAASWSLFTIGPDCFHDNLISWEFEIPSFSCFACFKRFLLYTHLSGSVAGRAVLTILTKTHSCTGKTPDTRLLWFRRRKPFRFFSRRLYTNTTVVNGKRSSRWFGGFCFGGGEWIFGVLLKIYIVAMISPLLDVSRGL